MPDKNGALPLEFYRGQERYFCYYNNERKHQSLRDETPINNLSTEQKASGVMA